MKKSYAVLVCCAVFFTLNGCGGEKKSQLNVFLPGTLSEPAEKLFFNDFVKGFEKQENVKVNITYSNDDGIDKINAEIDNNNVVTDVVLLATDGTMRFINNGWLEDITDFVNALDVQFVNTFDADMFVMDGVI